MSNRSSNRGALRRVATYLTTVCCLSAVAATNHQTDVKQQSQGGAAKTSLKTQGQQNGRYWMQLNSIQKIAWVDGFFAAAAMGKMDLMIHIKNDGKNTRDPQNQRDSFLFQLPTTLTIQELEESLDQFYADPTNRVIPIARAFGWIRGKAEGAPEDLLKSYETTLRREFAMP